MSIATWDTTISTGELASSLNPGDFVNVDGYGGFAEIQSIYEDGVGPHGHPKYRAVIKWGPSNTNIGKAKHARTGAIDDFPVGRLSPAIISEQQADDAIENKLDNMDEAALLARLAQINAQLQKAGC